MNDRTAGLAGARTPTGRLGGMLDGRSAVDLDGLCCNMGVPISPPAGRA